MEITISNSQEETLRSDKKGRKTRKQRFFIALITIPLKNLLKKNGKQAKKRLQYSKTETFTHTHKSQDFRLFGTLATYQKRADTFYPSVYPSELRTLLYIFHNIFHYSFRLSPTPSPEDIHQVALVVCSSDSQIERYYSLAREQHLVTSLPLTRTSSLCQKLSACN